MSQIAVTKDCPRCGGTGHHSYCQLYGTRCFQCGGTGKIACAPNGQKKIKPTCDHINRAQVGDIVDVSRVLYRVEEIRWIAVQIKGFSMFNQKARCTRLIDEKEMWIKREFFGYDPTSSGWVVDCVRGTKETSHTLIFTPEHLIDTVYDPSQYSEANKVTVSLSHGEIERYAHLHKDF